MEESPRLSHRSTEPPGSSRPDAVSPAVLDLIRRGTNVEAIRQYCRETGADLPAGKRVIGRLIQPPADPAP